jgi:transcriptional regulator with XRE-family HTH domain
MSAEELQIKIGQTVRQLRLDNDWTQEEVASRLYICRDAYGEIERGKTDICISRLTQIANLYSVDVTFLFGSLPCTTNYNQYNNSKSRINNHHNHCHIYSEEKSQNELEDKELAMQQREIAYLKELNEMMKKQSTQTE